MRVNSIRNITSASSSQRPGNSNRRQSVGVLTAENQQFDTISKRYGFSGFSVLDISQKRRGWIDPKLRMTNLDDGMMEQINSAGGLEQCSLIKCFAVKNVPIGWQFETDTEADNHTPISLVDRRLAKIFEKRSLHFGYIIPVYSISSRRYLVSYYSDKLDTNAKYPELVLDTIECFQSAFSDDREKSRKHALSKGEYDCLLWAAQGKNSYEIATILSLSEHTVNHYFSIIMEKLDANNRVHVISKAIQLGLIDIHDL